MEQQQHRQKALFAEKWLETADNYSEFSKDSHLVNYAGEDVNIVFKETGEPKDANANHSSRWGGIDAVAVFKTGVISTVAKYKTPVGMLRLMTEEIESAEDRNSQPIMFGKCYGQIIAPKNAGFTRLRENPSKVSYKLLISDFKKAYKVRDSVELLQNFRPLEKDYVVEVSPESQPQDYCEQITANKWICLNVAEDKFTLEQAMKWIRLSKGYEVQNRNYRPERVMMVDFDFLGLPGELEASKFCRLNNTYLDGYSSGKTFKEAFTDLNEELGNPM